MSKDNKEGNESFNPSSNAEQYFDDDLEFLAGDDEIVYKAEDTEIMKQQEGVISWEILDFYKDNGKPRSKYSLRSKPPILKISNSNGSEVEFMLTNNFAKGLGHVMKDVGRAYHGVSVSAEKKTLKEKLAEVKMWAVENKVKTGAFILVLVCFVVAIVL